MSSLPPQQNRVLQAVDALKKDIQQGSFVSGLPGERALAVRLRVSRKTLRKAMDVLEKEQWVSPAQHGKRREVLKSPKRDASVAAHSLQGKSVVVMAPRPLSHMGGIERLFQSRLTQYCEKSGITLRHRDLDVRHMKRPGYRLEEFIRKNPADVYLLQHSTQSIQQWFDKKEIPSIVLGDCWDGVNLPGVGGDHEANAVHLAGLLKRNGHRRLTMLYPKPSKRGLEIFVNKLEAVASDIDLTLVHYEENSESTKQGAQRLFTQQAAVPTVVLTTTMFATIAVASAAGRLGLRIPEDVSLISLSHDAALQYLQPAVAAYDIKWENYTKSVFKVLSDMLLHEGSHSIKPALVMPDFLPGGSLTAARPE